VETTDGVDFVPVPADLRASQRPLQTRQAKWDAVWQAELSTCVEQLRRNGFVVLRAALRAGAARELVVASLESLEPDSLAACYTEFYRTDNRVIYQSAHLREGLALSQLDFPFLRAVLATFEGSVYVATDLVVAKPNCGRQTMHRDVHATRPGEKTQLLLFTPLESVALGNGLTTLYAGTHLADGLADRPAAEVPESVDVRLLDGDVLLYFGSVQHLGQANRCPSTRIILSEMYEVVY